MADDAACVETLELTILSAEGLEDVSFFFCKKKMKSFVIAWVDPRLKKSTKTLATRNPFWNSNLSFPLHPQTLQNPTSFITLQVLSSRSRVVGSAILALSAIGTDTADTFTLQLWRPSGRARGLLRVSARIALSAGVFPIRGCVTGTPVGITQAALPSAPPFPEGAGDTARRNFLVGILSGVVAALLVGSAVI